MSEDQNKVITSDGEIVDMSSTRSITPANRPRLAVSLGELGTPNQLSQVTKQSFNTEQMVGKTFTVLSYEVREGTQYGDMIVMDCLAILTDSDGGQYALPFFCRSTAKIVREKMEETGLNKAFPVEVTVVQGSGPKGIYYTLK